MNYLIWVCGAKICATYFLSAVITCAEDKTSQTHTGEIQQMLYQGIPEDKSKWSESMPELLEVQIVPFNFKSATMLLLFCI